MSDTTPWQCPTCGRRFRIRAGYKAPAVCKHCRDNPNTWPTLPTPSQPLAESRQPPEVVFVDIGPDEKPRTAPAKPQSVPQRLPSVFVPIRPGVLKWVWSAFRPGNRKRTTGEAVFLMLSSLAVAFFLNLAYLAVFDNYKVVRTNRTLSDTRNDYLVTSRFTGIPLRKYTVFKDVYIRMPLDREGREHGEELRVRPDTGGVIDAAWYWHGREVGPRSLGKKRFQKLESLPEREAWDELAALIDRSPFTGPDGLVDSEKFEQWWREFNGPDPSDEEMEKMGYAPDLQRVPLLPGQWPPSFD